MQDSTETRNLLQQHRAGDHGAFERLFARYEDYLRNVVELRLEPELRRRIDPSDIIQETQLHAFQRFDDFMKRRPMPFRLWLRRTAYEKLTRMRERHVQASRRSVLNEYPLPDQSSVMLANRFIQRDPSPSQQLTQQEMASIVRRALASLRPPDREVLLMRYVEDLSNEEMACLLELEPATVSKRHGRALLRLQQALLRFGVGEEE